MKNWRRTGVLIGALGLTLMLGMYLGRSGLSLVGSAEAQTKALAE